MRQLLIKVLPLLSIIFIASCGRNLPDLEPGSKVDKLVTIDEPAVLSGVPLFDLRIRQRFNFDNRKGKDTVSTTVQVFNLSSYKIDSCTFLISSFNDSLRITKNLIQDFVYSVRDLGVLRNTLEDTINIVLPEELEVNKVEINILKIYYGSFLKNISSGYYLGDYETLTDNDVNMGQEKTRVAINADGSLSALFDKDFDIQKVEAVLNNNNYLYGKALNKDLLSINNIYSADTGSFNQVDDSLYLKLDCSLLNKDFKFLYFLLKK